MKPAFLPVVLCLLCAPLQAWVAVLDTPSFRIEIEHPCEEGCVSCDQIRYRSTEKKTQQSLALIGSTAHTMGPDGTTPAHFLGYRFANRSTVYLVGDDGRLDITQMGKLLLSEQGVWDSETKEPTSR